MPTDRHSIDLATAVELTTRWRKQHPEAIKGGRFDRAAFDRLLRQPDAAGIRIYLGEKADGSWTYVMVATTEEGGDILPALGQTASAGSGTGVEEETWPCPPDCPRDSPLNGGQPVS